MIRHLMAATALLATSALAAPADTVLLHGRIITADAKDSVVQALAISGGKIAALGSDAAIQTHGATAGAAIGIAAAASSHLLFHDMDVSSQVF